MVKCASDIEEKAIKEINEEIKKRYKAPATKVKITSDSMRKAEAIKRFNQHKS